MNILSAQIDALHEAERFEIETAGCLGEWYITVRVLQRDIDSGACTDNHWHLSLRRAKAQYERAALAHTAAADQLARIRTSVTLAETIDASFDESELTYVGPPPSGAEAYWGQHTDRTPPLPRR